MIFAPGDSLVVVKPFKTVAYRTKNWRPYPGKTKYAVGADAVCLGGGRYTIQRGPFKSVIDGIILSDAEAAEFLVKKN